MARDISRLFLKLGLFLPIFGFFVGVNFWADPAHLFRNEGYVDGIARLLLEGKNVANVSNYDAGLLQQYYVDGLTKRKDVVVLGSSRSMQVRASLFAPESFFNSSVDSATIQDLMAVYQIYYRKGLAPRTVILGLDYHMFSVNWPEKQGSLQNAFAASAKRMGQSVPSDPRESFRLELDKYAQLISPSYFQEALRVLPGIGRIASYYPTDGNDDEGGIKLSDGSLVYARVMRVKPTSEVRNSVMSRVDNYTKVNNVFDPNAAGRLSALIDLLQKDGVRVVLFLPPYHPYAYGYWATDDRLELMVRVQDLARALALVKQITLLGSYNPSDNGCDESEFFDEVHPKESCVNKIFAKSNLVTHRQGN